jgi:chaperone modulatory protein CbpM
MRVEFTEAVWMDEREQLSLAQLAEVSGLTEAELAELIDYDALAPADPRAEPATFGADCIITARTACRLRTDFDLDAHGLALVLKLLEQVHNLESELRSLQARLPGRARQ